jgi:glycosyltransferase involved in cell wall biosynthesis/cyclopropane fatty-acyl-phospholipid synthase-like methyltransferase
MESDKKDHIANDSPSRLLDQLNYAEFRAAALAGQTQRLSGSRSWKITSGLRTTNASLKHLLRVSKRFGRKTEEARSALVKDACKIISRSGLFDEHYYRQQLNERRIVCDDSLLHFLLEGWQSGLNPNFFFDCNYYTHEIEERGGQVTVNPLLHYLLEGHKCGAATSRFFDPTWYSTTYQDVLTSGITPLSHFVQFGLIEGRSPAERIPQFLTAESVSRVNNKPKEESAEAPKAPAYRQNQTGRWHKCTNRTIRQTNYDVLLCFHEASRTGSPMLGLSILKHLIERGYNCLAILLEGGELVGELQGLADVLDLSLCAHPETALSQELRSLRKRRILSGKPLVILNSSANAPIAGVFSEQLFRRLALIHEFMTFYPDNFQRLILNNAETVIFPSQSVKANCTFLEHFKGQSLVLPQGLLHDDFGGIDKTAAKQFLADTYGIPPQSFVVLACATIEPRKGVDFFVQAANMLLSKSHHDIHFVWVGAETDRPYEALRWARLDLKQGGIEGNVHFVGKQIDIEPYFAGADVFLLPSRQDPMPCVLHLAMSSALPSVAFEGAGGAEEVLENGGGKLAQYGNVSQLADAIEFYKLNPEVREADGTAAQEVVRTKYNMSQYVDKLISLTGLEQRYYLQQSAAVSAEAYRAEHSTADVESHYERLNKHYLATYGTVLQAARPASVEELLRSEWQQAQLHNGLKVLDAGCGFCGPAIYFAQRSQINIDCVTISAEQAKIGRQLVEEAGLSERIRVHKGDYNQLEQYFAEESFDRVLFLESLCHTEDYRKTLTSARAVLKSGGMLFIKDFFLADPSPDAQTRSLKDKYLGLSYIDYSYRMIYLQDLVSLLSDLGFTVKSLTKSPFAGAEDPSVQLRFEEAAGLKWRDGICMELAFCATLLAEKI